MSTHTEPPVWSSHRCTLLIVEDDSVVRRLMARLFRDSHDVVLAESGTAAITVLRQRPFSVVLADLMLPDIDGIDVLEVARQVQPDAGRVLMTGHVSLDAALDAIHRGAVDALVEKPVKPGHLVEVVERAGLRFRLALQDAMFRDQCIGRARAESLAMTRALVLHDVRNLLYSLHASRGGIHAAAERLVEHGEDADRQALFDELAGLDTLVSALCNAVRTEVHPASAATVSMAAVFAQVQRMVRPSCPHTLLVSFVAPEVCWVNVRSVDLVRILVNLVSNAIQALVEHCDGFGSIHVRAVEVGSHVIISVRDDGPGIAESVRSRLFQPGVTTRADVGGSGHGLYLCAELARLAGGQLTSLPQEKGTLFCLSLPSLAGAEADAVA